MTALDRLVANGNALIGAYKQFGSATAGTVSFVWIQDDDTEEIITFDNIVKFQSKITQQLTDAMTEINTLKDSVNIQYVDGELKLVDGSSLNYMTQTDMNEAITQQVTNLNTTAIRLAAIGAVNLRYSQADDALYDAEDNEVSIVTGTQLTEALNALDIPTMPTVPTNTEIENLALAKTNIQYGAEGLKDKDGNPIIISSSSDYEPSFIDFLLKDESDTSISEILFNLSSTSINHADIESLELIGTNVNSSSACRFQIYTYDSNEATIVGTMAVSRQGINNANIVSGNVTGTNNQIWFPIEQDVNPQSNGRYGQGINFTVKIPVKAISDAGVLSPGTIAYTCTGWMYSSTYATREEGQWADSGGNGWHKDIYGFKLFPSAGTFQRGIIKVRVNLKSKKIGA